MSKAKNLIESLIDGGKLPADLIYDICYGVDQRSISLTEETGGDVSIPENPGEEELVDLGPNEMAVFLEDPEDKAVWSELLSALDAASVYYEVEEVEQTGETILKWTDNDEVIVRNTLLGLGIQTEEDDYETPEETIDYYENDESRDKIKEMISNVVEGESPQDVINRISSNTKSNK